MLRIVIVFMAWGILSCSALQQTEYTLQELPTFKINLDLEPEERYNEVIAYFKEGALDLVDYFLDAFPDIVQHFAEKVFDKLDPFLRVTHPSYYKEITGIANGLEIPMWQALVVQYIYELGSYCTSIVGRQADGTIIHGRNLDFDPADLGRDISYVAHFIKDGEHLYSGVQFAGTVGLFTGIREGGFSISQNTRYSDFTLAKFIENMELIFKGYYEVSWMIRDTLEACETFECGFNNFVTEPLITLSYLTVAGVGRYEGAVISRDRFGAAHIEMLSEENWYVAQTNDDHFTGKCRGRCTNAHNNMDALGTEGLNKDSMKSDVMFDGPTLNDITMYDAIMIPSQGYMDAVGVDSDYPNEP